MRLEKAKVIESKDKGRKVKAVTADGEEIYLGYSKECAACTSLYDIELFTSSRLPVSTPGLCCKRSRHCRDLDVRKSGRRGRSIRDDPRKYPGKEDLGIFCKPP